MKKYMYSFLGLVIGAAFFVSLQTQVPEAVIATDKTIDIDNVINIESDDYFTKIDDTEKIVGYRLSSEEFHRLIENKTVVYGRKNPMAYTVISTNSEEGDINDTSWTNDSESDSKNINSSFIPLHNAQYSEINNGFIKGYNKSTTKIEDLDISNIITAFKGQTQYPLNSNFIKVSSPFGVRGPIRELGSTDYEFHTGVDYANAGISGEPIYSVSNGTVKKIQKSNQGYGNLVIIESNGIDLYYAHLSSIRKEIKEGDSIEIGSVIGQVGSTGRSTGPHLHFEINVGDIAINPELFLRETNAKKVDLDAQQEDSNKLIDEEYLEKNKIKPL